MYIAAKLSTQRCYRIQNGEVKSVKSHHEKAIDAMTAFFVVVYFLLLLLSFFLFLFPQRIDFSSFTCSILFVCSGSFVFFFVLIYIFFASAHFDRTSRRHMLSTLKIAMYCVSSQSSLSLCWNREDICRHTHYCAWHFYPWIFKRKRALRTTTTTKKTFKHTVKDCEKRRKQRKGRKKREVNHKTLKKTVLIRFCVVDFSAISNSVQLHMDSQHTHTIKSEEGTIKWIDAIDSVVIRATSTNYDELQASRMRR